MNKLNLPPIKDQDITTKTKNASKNGWISSKIKSYTK